MGVLKGCQPRNDLLSNNINLEIFTASLNQVANHYKGQSSGHPLYTDAQAFFTEGTYFTENMKMVLRDVFTRLNGDTTASALKRLETGFGGGKTHTLIACLHLAKKGKELAPLVSDFLKAEDLPEPGTVDVVAIAGDVVPVKQTRGVDLKPYPLWAEIARQIGGPDLCGEVTEYMVRLDSPDEKFFSCLFAGRKVLILVDELAHYAARWAVAYPTARAMISTFFMSLLEYASQHPGISVVVTLAGLQDAFSASTAELAKTLSDITGNAVDTGQALSIQQDAAAGLTGILARRETVVVPVNVQDVSAVLGKRLFEWIDRDEAKRTVDEYRGLYERNWSLLPGDLQTDNYSDRMLANYPFHPSMLDLLNNKLSTVPTFQKTRGVLRILALAVRALWKNGKDVPMIHPCHLDFMNSRTVDELLGRTGNTPMLPVLNADIGTSDTAALEGGQSNAELADRENPHPDKIPYHVLTWKTVFLHSLAGQGQGFASPVFGINEPQALLAVSYPGLTPAQARQALADIKTRAFYLRENNGLYYAGPEPNVNLALSKIRGGLTEEQLITEIETKARKLFSQNRQGFSVKTDIVDPQGLPDQQERSLLGVLSFRLENVDPIAFITTAGRAMPRMYQNGVFLLIPETTKIQYPGEEASLFPDREDGRERIRQELYLLARDVLAIRRLKDNPQNFGLNQQQLTEAEVDLPKREKDLETRISLIYRFLAYPVKDGIFAVKDIRTAGGEGGVAQFEQIRTVLKENGEIITAGSVTKETLVGLGRLFFEEGDYITLGRIREKFHIDRGWPVLEDPDSLANIVREGVAKGHWGLVTEIDESTGRPKDYYDGANPDIPLHKELDSSCALVTLVGAKGRGWGTQTGPTREEVRRLVESAMEEGKGLRVAQVKDEVNALRNDAQEEIIAEILVDFARGEKILAYEGDPAQEKKPDKLISGAEVVLMRPTDEMVFITLGEAVRRGWMAEKPTSMKMSGDKGLSVLTSGLMRKLSSLYTRGAQSAFKRFDVLEFDLPGGGRFSLMIRDAEPEAMRHLGELFEILADKLTPSSASEVFIEISDPDENCPLIQEIRGCKETNEP